MRAVGAEAGAPEIKKGKTGEQEPSEQCECLQVQAAPAAHQPGVTCSAGKEPAATGFSFLVAFKTTPPPPSKGLSRCQTVV